MPLPTPIVEIAFDDSPYAVSPTWTAVTSYVRSMTVDRGRSDDWGDFSGSASVVLDNRDRRFDPFNTSGIYYGKLLPRRQIRIRAQTVELGVTTTHDVFRGFVNGWAPEWTNGGKDSTVTLSCFDAMQLLASEQLPADWSRSYILSTSPRHYYPCDEPITAFSSGTLKDYGSNASDVTLTTFASSGSQLAVGLPNSSLQVTESSGGSAFSAAIGATNFSVSVWGIFDGTGASGLGGAIGTCGWYIGFNQATGKYVITIDDQGSGLTRTFTSNNTYDGGAARLISFTFNVTTKAFQLYLDAIAVATTAATAGAIIVIIGEILLIGTGQMQQICVWNSIQTVSVFQEIYKYSTVNLPESTSARFNRIIAETSFSTSLRSVPASPSNTVLDITDDAPYVTPELQKVADSEGGALFVSKNGTLTMFGQNQIRTQSSSIVSQVTYGDSGTAMGLEVQLAPDGDSMRNVVNVTMSQGGVYVRENSASVTAYGTASMSIDTQVSSLANADRLGTIATGWGGQVYPRLSPIDVVLSRDNLWSPTMALELMDRITVNVKPPTGNTVSVPMLVQRISHSVVAGRWQTTLEGSARWAAVWIWDTSTWDGTDLLG